MNVPEHERLRPSVGWLVFWGSLLWVVGFAMMGYQSSPGQGRSPEIFVARGLGKCVVLLPVFLIGLAAVVSLYKLFKCKSGKLRAVVVLIPVASISLLSGLDVVINPPSPATFFRNKTEVELPDDAREIEAVDREHLQYFYFRTSPAGVAQLQSAFQMKNMEVYDGQLETMGIMFQDAPAPPPREECRRFSGRDGARGVVTEMLTNASMTEVWFSRDSSDKRDKELRGEM